MKKHVMSVVVLTLSVVKIYSSSASTRFTRLGQLSGNNTALGHDSLLVLSDSESSLNENKDNTGIGVRALYELKSGNRNTALGSYAGSTLKKGSHNIYISVQGPNEEEDTIRIGKPEKPGYLSHTSCYIGGIHNKKIGKNAMVVIIDDEGKLGTISMDELLKGGKAKE